MTTQADDSGVAVIGMGYVGASLSAVLADHGFSVCGIDIDPERVKQMTAGNCPVEEAVITDLFEKHTRQGNITVSDEYTIIPSCHTVIITVGTPLTESDPDLSAVKAATMSTSKHLTEETTVIYRSTLPAGTTENTVQPIYESKTEFTAGDEFHLAFCPERMAEGSAYEDLTTTPVIIGGTTDECTECAVDFWDEVGLDTHAVSSPTTAELTKLADNWWIDLNIALANEVALLSEKIEVDGLEVIAAANTLEKGSGKVNILQPGTGVGGSCLIKDPRFVADLGDQYGLDLKTPRVSRKVNEQMPAHMLDLLQSELSEPRTREIAVLGYSFKGETDDTRNTPAREIVMSIQDLGAEVHVSDPYAPADVIQSDTGIRPERLNEAVAGVDAIVIVTGHETYRELECLDLVKMVGSEDFTIVDGRNVFALDEFDNSRVNYRGVGRGTRE